MEAIKLLVKLGCKVTVQDSVASTPLHVAAGEGNIDAIMALTSLVCPSHSSQLSLAVLGTHTLRQA